MDLPPFLSKDDKLENNNSNQDKKIEFSQKLSNEDMDDLPKKAADFSGNFNASKNNNKTPSINLGQINPEIKDKEKLGGVKLGAVQNNDKNKLEIKPKQKKGFLDFFKKKSNGKIGGGNILDVNLVKGEIVKYFDWQRSILILLVAIFASLFVISFVYWGISWWGSKVEYTRDPFLVQKYYKLDKEIKVLDEEIKEIIYFKEKVQLVDDLLNKHIYWNNYFDLLEELTLSNVHFDNFSGNPQGSYVLSAVTNDFDAIDAQIKKLTSHKYIKNAQVSSGAISGAGSEGAKVSFSLNFSIDPALFVN